MQSSTTTTDLNIVLRPELMIGIIAPIGVDLNKLIADLLMYLTIVLPHEKLYVL
ncbi:MAG: hypothetical protein JW841_09840 [Deltaproteobacteria bacterium]|nr:hypothetical protein [Deltaproteobacteria bacterium]